MNKATLQILKADVLTKFQSYLDADEDYSDAQPIYNAAGIDKLEKWHTAHKNYLEAKNKWEKALLEYCIERQTNRPI